MDVEKTTAQQLGWNYEFMGELDHRIVKAPYIRLTSVTSIDDVRAGLFDLRFTQPNINRMQTSACHSLEHLMAVNFKKRLPENFINLAPLGCLTGFYLSLLGELNAKIVTETYIDVLEEVLSSTEVPLCNEVECGWAADHSLEGAQEQASKVLLSKASLQQVY